MHGVSDAAKLPCTSPSRGSGDVAFDELDRLSASDYLTFGAQYPCPHAPLPTLQPQPHGQHCTARGKTPSATPFVSRDSHPLPFTSSPGAPSLPDSHRNLARLSIAALRNLNGLASWRNAENSLQSVDLTMLSFAFPCRRFPAALRPASLLRI